MSQEHIGYPYDFAKDDPIEAYWRTHAAWNSRPLSTLLKEMVQSGEIERHKREQVARWRLQFDPWCNGRYALAAMVWGLIFMLVISVMA